MANWNSNDGFRSQRKRTFIYKSAAQNKQAENTLKGDPNLTTVASQSFSSPRKKIKSSYSYYDKTRSDRMAAEELCSDLPADAFEDDLGVDFGDDLTVEELCEAACVAEEEMAHKDKKMNENVTKYEARGEGDFKALDKDILEEATRKHLNSTVRPQATSVTADTSGTVTDETKFETSALETTALLFSSPGCSTNRNSDAMMQRNLGGGSKAHVSNGCANGDTRMLEDLTFIKSKLLESKEVIKKLEEDKFLMDGELKTLRDTLEHTQTVDAKQRERIRIIEEENRKTIDEKEKELKKQIEHLTTQLCFKDQEIAQAKEQMKRQMQTSNENMHLSPHRKKYPKLAESSVIPIGQSFFEKKPADVQSSPKNKVLKLQKSPVKDKPEAMKHVLGSSSARNVSLDSREFEIRCVKREKHIVDGRENELLQKLLKLENIGVKSMSPEFEVCGVNQNILSLLNSSSKVDQEQSRKEDDVDVQKLVKQPSYTPKKGIQLDLSTEPKDNRLHQSVYNSIQELLNAQPSSFNDKHEACLDLVSNCKASIFFDSHQESFTVQGFLPLLEYHISQYIDLRLENDEESLSSTCSPGSPGEGGEMTQPADKDGSVSLLEALDLAVQSLRCLNILVLHSDGVCELLLRSAKVFSSNENEAEELIGTSRGPQQSCSSNEEKSDVLNLVFKLTVPLQNEPQLITQAALNVISSLAQRCPSEYRTRYLSLLCDRLLPQCISRDSSVTMISLVVPILMVAASIPSLIRCLCSQSDECLLLKVYQGCLSDMDNMSHHVIFEVIDLIEKILSSRNDAIPLLLDSECHCSLELIKYLVLLLHKKMVFLGHFLPDTLKLYQESRDSFILLRRGMFLLANLLINSSRLLADLHVEVEKQYVNLIIGTARLYGAIKDIPDGEGMLLQDLLDFEHIEDDEVQQDYDEDGIEDMDVDTS